MGAPCRNRVCRRLGYHFIPEEYHVKQAGRVESRPIPLVGTLVEKYLVVDYIGGGGFATVYLALQQPVMMKCALKVMIYEADSRQRRKRRLERFRAEAAALALLNHPNIVRLLQFGSHESQPYLVMEYVPGRTLKSEISRRSRSGAGFHPALVKHIVDQILSGLEEAHRVGIVHRDVKPANILLQDIRGYPFQVRLVDFGLAKFVEEDPHTLALLGTADYAAPEQSEGGEVTPAADTYALTVVLSEMLIGRSPFPDADKDAADVDTGRTYDLIRLPEPFDYPEQVADFLRKGLDRNPGKRFSSAREFREGLAEIMELLIDGEAPELMGQPSTFEEPGDEEQDGGADSLAELDNVSMEPESDTQPRIATAVRAVWVTAAVLLLAAAAVGAGWFLKGLSGLPAVSAGAPADPLSQPGGLPSAEADVNSGATDAGVAGPGREVPPPPSAPDVTTRDLVDEASSPVRDVAAEVGRDSRLQEQDLASSDMPRDVPEATPEPAPRPEAKKRVSSSGAKAAAESAVRHKTAQVPSRVAEEPAVEPPPDEQTLPPALPVTVRLTSVPPEVSVMEGKTSLGETPLDIDVPRGAVRNVVFIKQGYNDKPVPVDGEKLLINVTMEMTFL